MVDEKIVERVVSLAAETTILAFALILLETHIIDRSLWSLFVIGFFQGWATRPKQIFVTVFVCVLAYFLNKWFILELLASFGSPVEFDWSSLRLTDLINVAAVIVTLVVGNYVGRGMALIIKRGLGKTRMERHASTSDEVDADSDSDIAPSSHDRRIDLIHRYLKALEPALGAITAVAALLVAIIGSFE